MISRKNTSRKLVLLLSVVLGLFGLNLTNWRAVASSGAMPALATTYITYLTGFDGKSGGIPEGWADIGFDPYPQSTIVEKGSVVAITDIRPPGDGGGPQLIQSNFTITAPSDPSATVTLKAIATTTNTQNGQTQVIVGLGNVNGNAVVAAFNESTKEFHINLVQSGKPVVTFPLTAPTIDLNPGGGPFVITLSFDADSFRLTIGESKSGDLTYASAGVADFDSLDDFGANVGIILGAGAEGISNSNIVSTVNFESVRLDVTGSGPPPQQQIEALIAQVKSLLPEKEAKALDNTLNQAVMKLDHNACKPLGVFIQQVNDYINDGLLSQTAGEALITDANSIKTSIGCP